MYVPARAYTRVWTTRVHPPCSPTAETGEGSYEAALPWSKPVRMREKVMKTRWALLRCASSGVAAVMKPQAEADSTMTFSPPILDRTGGQQDSDGSCAARRTGRPRRSAQSSPRVGAAAPSSSAEEATVGVQVQPVCPNEHPLGCRGLLQGELCTCACPRPPPRGAPLSQGCLALGGALLALLLPEGSPSPARGAARLTGPLGGRPPPASGSSPRRSC